MLALALLLLSPVQDPGAEMGAMIGELRALRAEVSTIRIEVFQSTDAFLAMKDDLGALREEVRSSRERGPLPRSPPRSWPVPPVPSDLLGVAKTAVFAPRVEVGLHAPPRHRDPPGEAHRRRARSTRWRRWSSPSDAAGVDLPLDQNGALYLVEWLDRRGPDLRPHPEGRRERPARGLRSR